MSANLRDKFFGCICGCHIGSAMGAPVEGMKYQEIEDKYGFVKDYLPYQHYGNGWIENQEQQKMVLNVRN